MGFQLLLKFSPSWLCHLLTKLKVKRSRASRWRKRERLILQECKTMNNIYLFIYFGMLLGNTLQRALTIWKYIN